MFGNVNDVVWIDIEECRTDQLGGPGCQQPAFLIEYLHPIILPIGNQQPAATIDPHTMRQVELAWCFAWFTPRKQMLSRSRELMDARIAVAVAHEHRSVSGEGDISRQVEWPPPCVTFRRADELKSSSGTPMLERCPRSPMVCSNFPSAVNFMNCMWCPSVSQAIPWSSNRIA